MRYLPAEAEIIILLDNPDLYREVTILLRKLISANQPAMTISELTSGGTGFTQSRRFKVNDVRFNFLLINPENAHPFAYLTLGQRALRRRVPLVVAISQARTFKDGLFAGDIALVSNAIALPYPALFQNRNPFSPNEPTTEVYSANPEVLGSFSKFADTVTSPKLWQVKIPIVKSGYTKHPTHGGGLHPWAPEQFEQMKESGIDTVAETPSGVYEFQQLSPATSVVCFNMVTGPTRAQLSTEWERHKKKLLYPAIRLLLDIVEFYKIADSEIKSAVPY